MAAFKFTFFLCAALLVFQAQALPQSKTQNLEDIDVIGILKKIVVLVEKVLDWAVQTATDVSENITTEKWNDFQAKTVDVTRKALTVVLDKIIKDLQSMGEQSTDAGKKLAGCVASAKDDILSVPVSFWDDVSKCVGEDLIALAKALGPVIKDLAGVQSEAKAAADQIDKCQGNDIQSLLCVAEVAGNLLKIVGEIPAKINPDIQPVLDDLKALVGNIEKCVKTEVPVYFQNAGKALDKIATCAA